MASEQCLIWSEAEEFWNNNEFFWNLCQVVVEVVPSQEPTGAFVDHKKKRYSERWKLYKDKQQHEEEPKKIKLICLINGKKIEEEKYIGKHIKIDSSMERLKIVEIKKMDVNVDKISLSGKKTYSIGEDGTELIVLDENNEFLKNIKTKTKK